jgi:hypothetical protein
MPIENALAVAAPPGRILPTAFPASCEHETVNQLFTWSAIRSSCHKQTKLPVSLRSARAAQYHVRWESDRQEPKTAVRLGSSA